jgi:AraC-like DNA-binding protein
MSDSTKNRPETLPRLRLATADLPEHERLAIWHEFYGRSLFNVGIKADGETPFEAKAEIIPVGACAISAVNSSRVSYYVSKEYLPTAQDTTVIVNVKSGRLHGSQRGQEATIGAGQAVAILSNEVGAIDVMEPGDYLSIYVPTAAIAAVVPDLGKVLMQPLDQNSGALQLLTSYATALQTITGPMPPQLGQVIGSHLIELAANVFGLHGAPHKAAEANGVRAARRQAIKDDIATHLTRHDLSPDDVARRVGIKPRYMRELLQDDGTSFSDLLRHMRLQLAHRQLSDPQLATSSISTIAYQVGFSDLSYFNRCFRRQFGATPSEVRELALQKP